MEGFDTGKYVVQEEYMECVDTNYVVTPQATKLLTYLEECKMPQDISSGSLCSEILRITNHQSQTTIIGTKLSINLIICRKTLHTASDIYLVDEYHIDLLIKNTHFIKMCDIVPMLITKAIAAFKFNENPTLLIFINNIFNLNYFLQ